MEMSRFTPISGSRYPVPPGIQVECGDVVVPESRSPASGLYPSPRTLRLYVTRVRSLRPDPAPDPVVFLYGGPGGNHRWVLSFLEEPPFRDAFLADRDLILFDQRGSGYSEPAMFAPEMDSLENRIYLEEIDAETSAKKYVAAALRARDRYLQAGLNLAAINTPEIAADLNDVCRALGYQRVNLFGISYGTRPALAAMRDFPEFIRSVVLDSTVPIQVSQYIGAIPNAIYAFERLFAAVEDDPAARRAYPNLRQVFFELCERLDRQPVRLPAKHPETGEPVEIRLTGEIFLGAMCGSFYSAETIAALPARIFAAWQGDFHPLVDELASQLKTPSADHPGWSIGMYYSVNLCDDKVTPETASEIARQAEAAPRFRWLPLTEFHLGPYIAELGEKWRARQPGPAEFAPVYSDIPTLILAGVFDQNTPAYWGKLAGETLSRSTYLEFPNMGHGVIGEGELPPRLVRAFYQNPDQPPGPGSLQGCTPPDFVKATV